MFVEMKVRGLALDPMSNMPIIILRDEEDKRSLPIWVGIFEANAIALELEKIATPRPMTHDLIKNILEAIEARVVKVVVTDLKENTFFAVLHLQQGDAEYTVDSRPSDAIALALRVAAPIYVDEDVVRKAKSLEVPTKEEAEPVRADEWMLLELWPMKAGGARGVYAGSLRGTDGRLGAVLVQEMLLRERPLSPEILRRVAEYLGVTPDD